MLSSTWRALNGHRGPSSETPTSIIGAGVLDNKVEAPVVVFHWHVRNYRNRPPTKVASVYQEAPFPTQFALLQLYN